MKINIVILFFIPFQLVCSEFIDKFNQSVEVAKRNNFKEAIVVLETLRENINNQSDQNKAMFYYQTGTLYCMEKEYNKCLKNLKQAYFYNKNNDRVKKNIELAFRFYNKSEKNKDNQEKEEKKEKSKKDDFNKKFENQIMSLRFAESKRFEKNFSLKMKKQIKRCAKDW